MRYYLLPKGAKQYKANLHCHTNVSDGTLSPSEIKAMYQRAGYSAVAFTDHEVFLRHAELTDASFVALHGYETAIKDGTPEERTGHFMKVHHLCLLAKEADNDAQVCFYPENFTPGNCASYIPFLKYRGEKCVYDYSTAFVNHLIETANAAGFLVTYNHPRWSLQTLRDLEGIEGLFGMEVYNGGCLPHGDASTLYFEDFLRGGKRVMPIGGDDNHNGGGRAEFGAFTVIAAEKLDYRSLTDALVAGNAYASMGPMIDELYFEGEFLTVRTPAPYTVTLRSEGRYTAVSRGVSFASFRVRPEDCGRYFRLELADGEGKTAATRAFFFDEFSLPL